MEALNGVFEFLSKLFEGFDPKAIVDAIIGAIGGLINGGGAA